MNQTGNEKRKPMKVLKDFWRKLTPTHSPRNSPRNSPSQYAMTPRGNELSQLSNESLEMDLNGEKKIKKRKKEEKEKEKKEKKEKKK